MLRACECRSTAEPVDAYASDTLSTEIRFTAEWRLAGSAPGSSTLRLANGPAASATGPPDGRRLRLRAGSVERSRLVWRG